MGEVNKKMCPRCHGTVAGTRKIKLEASVANHEKSCPSRVGTSKEKTS